MFGWLKPKSTLQDERRRWVDSRFDWLVQQFGADPLSRPIVTPSDQFFPDAYRATTSDVEILFNRVCGYMGVDPGRIDLSFYQTASADDVTRAFDPSFPSNYALGVFQEGGEKSKISLESSKMSEPELLVATMSHELGHYHLLVGGRCDPSVEDHEQLTDLLTVFFGFGIFSGNSSLRESNWSSGLASGWSMSRSGYLSMGELAYALAVYADARDEMKPEWIRHLRKDLRALVKVELDLLHRSDKFTGGSGLDRLRQRARPTGDVTRTPVAVAATPSTSSESWDVSSKEEAPSVPNSVPIMKAAESDRMGRSDADELFAHGVFLAGEGNWEEALVAFTRSLEINPRDNEVWSNRGAAHLALKQYEAAIEDYSQAIQIDRESPGAYSGRALAKAWLHEYSDAISDAKIALRHDWNDVMAHYIQGMAFFGLSQYKKALLNLNNAIQCSPRAAELYLARARIHAALKRERQAQADMVRAIECDSTLSDHEVRASTLAGRELV